MLSTTSFYSLLLAYKDLTNLSLWTKLSCYDGNKRDAI